MAKRDRQPGNQHEIAMAAGVRTLINLLGDSVATLTEVQTALQIGNYHPAIGSISELETRLMDAIALQRAIVVLHRYR